MRGFESGSVAARARRSRRSRVRVRPHHLPALPHLRDQREVVAGTGLADARVHRARPRAVVAPREHRPDVEVVAALAVPEEAVGARRVARHELLATREALVEGLRLPGDEPLPVEAGLVVAEQVGQRGGSEHFVLTPEGVHASEVVAPRLGRERAHLRDVVVGGGAVARDRDPERREPGRRAQLPEEVACGVEPPPRARLVSRRPRAARRSPTNRARRGTRRASRRARDSRRCAGRGSRSGRAARPSPRTTRGSG